MKKLSPNKMNWLKGGIALLIGITAYFAIAFNYSISILQDISIKVRFNLISTILGVGAFIFFSLWLEKKIKFRFSLIAVMMIFAFALAGVWTRGYTGPQIIGGLLPVGDANSYYQDSLRLFSGNWLAQDYRNIFSSFFASLLGIVSGNFQVALSIIMVSIALASWIALKEIEQMSGDFAATFFLVFIFIFIRYYAGKTMTELMGFLFGLLSLVMVIRAISLSNFKWALIGLFFLCFSMMVRPGPIVLVILLSVWIVYSFKNGNSILKKALLIGIVILLGFFIDTLIRKSFSTSEVSTFSNFAQSFYSLARGGVGWGLIYIEHPELFAISPPVDFYSRIIELSFHEILSNPLLLLKGIGYQYFLLFNPFESYRNIFSFFMDSTNNINTMIQITIYLLSIIGLVWSWKNRKQGYYSLVGIVILGILFSVPLLPTIDSNYARPYASVIPYLGLLPMVGFDFIINKFRVRKETPVDQIDIKFVIAIGFSLITITLLGPLILKTFPPNNYGKKITCTVIQDQITVRLSDNSSISILPNDNQSVNRYISVREDQFARDLHDLPSTLAGQRYENIQAPAILYNIIDENSGIGLTLVINDRMEPEPAGLYGVCGHWDQEDAISGYSRFFFVENIYTLH